MHRQLLATLWETKTHKVVMYGGLVEHYEIVDGYLEMFVGYEHTCPPPERIMATIRAKHRG